ncbi:MAG: SRPBCC domain-containing protein [Gemmatimonadota bacterium]|nr:SRPBCC domain-containing protein [Gemmatimonadota bacterium]
MKRPSTPERKTDDKACKAETGKSKAEWFAAIDKGGAGGRAVVGKLLQTAKVDPWWITVLSVEYEAAQKTVEKDGKPKGYSICSTKSVAANAAKTWKALTTSAELAKWFGSGATMEATEGGALRDKDGVSGTVTKVRPEKALVFTWDADWAAGSTVEVLVQPKGDKTGLVVNHTRIQTRADADAVREAWSQALNALKTHIEG